MTPHQRFEWRSGDPYKAELFGLKHRLLQDDADGGAPRLERPSDQRCSLVRRTSLHFVRRTSPHGRQIAMLFFSICVRKCPATSIIRLEAAHRCTVSGSVAGLKCQKKTAQKKTLFNTRYPESKLTQIVLHATAEGLELGVETYATSQSGQRIPRRPREKPTLCPKRHVLSASERRCDYVIIGFPVRQE